MISRASHKHTRDPGCLTQTPRVLDRQARGVESQFGTKGITVDKTQFDYVVSSLDNTTAGEVEAILTAPPDNNKYDSLKAALLAAFGKTQAQKDSELLSITGLKDMKPSALLRRLQSLNSDPATLFRAHFLALLPSEVLNVLAGREIPDISDLAKAADRIMEARGFDSHVISCCSSGFPGTEQPPAANPPRWRRCGTR